ncbi:hypothetical protein L218DRAFT_972849 [Marasmius fiardii PR-910]|nr:hypothetical protein L218DRAFT_972849 [Marasmius fiardii PR-910]
MKPCFLSKTVLITISYLNLSCYTASVCREVTQKHLNEPILRSVSALINKNNPNKLDDPVIGPLGNTATQNRLEANLVPSHNPNCLQQNITDRASTNAKAAKDVTGQVDALIYRALERSSGSVSGMMTACTAKAINPGNGTASPNTAQVNKVIVLDLAKQISSSRTFKPGQLSDSMAKGNNCIATTSADLLFI